MAETTLTKLQNSTENEIRNLPQVTVGFTTLQGFELMQRSAKLLSACSLMPKEFQGNLPNCVIALNMAHRIGADPLMVAQNLYVVHGRPGWSAQFLIASFNTCGRFSALRYEFTGKPGTDEYGCRAWAVEKDTNEKLFGSQVTVALAKKEGWYGKNGSKWQTMPQQMLMYRAASWFIRAYAPEIAMGLHTADELEDCIIDITPSGITTDEIRQNMAAVAENATTEHDPETGEVKDEGPLVEPGTTDLPDDDRLL